MSDRNQAPQVPLWFLLAVMAMMGLTAAGFLFLGTRLAPGAIMPQEQMKLMDLAYAHIQRNYVDALGPEESEDLVHKAMTATPSTSRRSGSPGSTRATVASTPASAS